VGGWAGSRWEGWETVSDGGGEEGRTVGVCEGGARGLGRSGYIRRGKERAGGEEEQGEGGGRRKAGGTRKRGGGREERGGGMGKGDE